MKAKVKIDKSTATIFEKMDEIERILEISFQDKQDFEDIYNQFALGEKKAISGTVNQCIIKNWDHMRFITEIPPGGSFPNHFHNCKEVCMVMAGTLKDKLRPKQKWELNEQVFYNKMVPHIPYNDRDITLVLMVDFYR